MYAGLRDVKRFTLSATDGDLGVIKDFLFDDRAWTVRYMHADTHKWLPLGEKVLISPISLRDIYNDEEKIYVSLSMQQVKDSPSIDEHKTVSREYEALLFKYFGYGYYWTGPGVWGEYAYPTELANTHSPDMEDFETEADSSISANHLRSIDELQGYDIKTKDHTFGKVYDLILNTDSWVIPLIVVETHSVLPGGKKVLITPKHIQSIDWLEHYVSSHLTVEQIKHCPEYDPALLNDENYQKNPPTVAINIGRLSQSAQFILSNYEHQRSLPKKLQSQLDELSAEFDKLKAKTDKAQADVQLDYYKQIKELQLMQEAANSKLVELKAASDDAWEHLKAGMDSAWNSLSNALKSATSRFK